MLRRIPDWVIYGFLLFVILSNAMGRRAQHDMSLPPEPGPPLPNVRPSDPSLIVKIDKPASSTGSAFASDRTGNWLTARHVVDSCDEVGLRLARGSFVRVDTIQISRKTDIALLTSQWKRPPLARDFNSQRTLGERGFFFGFPQGEPGEAAGALMGRHRLIVHGRYRSTEPVLAWAEIGRTRGLRGSLGGLSGGPAFDTDGEVIGIVAAENPRRGRIYTVAPRSLSAVLRPLENEAKTEPISMENYGRQANQYRRNRRIAQILCLVK